MKIKLVLSSIFLLGNIYAQSQNKPNIVVFIADDAGMDFGCYGNKNIKTPNIDKIAESGMRFAKAFLTSPQSSPSRTSMMTGQFAHTIGTEDLHMPLDEKTKMMPYYFRKIGYYTGCMFKQHWGPNGTAQFDCVVKSKKDPILGDLSDYSFENYKKFIDNRKKNPFFLWVGFTDPHRSYNREKCPQINAPQTTEIPPYLVNASPTRRDMADYYDEISRMDRSIGKMMKYLEDKGLMDNTVIVFLSDNGKPFPRAKGTLYDSGIQTPLLFKWTNKIQKSTVHSNGLVSTIDLAATLLDIAGTSMGDSVYSRSFKALLFDHTRHGRDYVFSERNWHDTDEYIRSVRTENMKLIYNAYWQIPHGTSMDLSTSLSWYDLKAAQRKGTITKNQMQLFVSPRAMVEIYDLKKDPNELDNVADIAEYVEKGIPLAKLLTEWQKSTKDHPWWRRRRPDQSDRITGFPLKSREDFYVK